MRRPFAQSHSMERLFADIRSALPPDIAAEALVCPWPSKGLLPRLKACLWAARHQGDVNHVTGDVHFLTYFLRRRQTILTIHDCVSLERSRGLKHAIFWFFWYWLPIRRAAVVTVVSTATKEALQRYVRIPDAKIRVISNNVSAEFRYIPHEFNAKCPRILHIGSAPHKNLHRVAEALQGIPCHMVVIGTPPADHLQRLRDCDVSFEQKSNLTRDELRAEYEQCDLLLFASTYEGFGLPIIEAQATGRPVVTSNAHSMPDVAGDGACLVDPWSVQSIRAGVQAVISDPTYRDQLLAAGQSNVRRFAAAAVAEQYAQAYREAAMPSSIVAVATS